MGGIEIERHIAETEEDEMESFGCIDKIRIGHKHTRCELVVTNVIPRPDLC